jgi:hypothetical protein
MSQYLFESLPSLSIRTELRGQLKNILRDVRLAFHSAISADSEDSFRSLFGCNPREFEEAIKSRPADQQNSLKVAYGLVWIHEPIEGMLQAGENKTILASKHLEAQTPEIEDLAHIYCSYKYLTSPTLEWAILNALVFSETVLFARSALANVKIAGVPVAFPLQPAYKRVLWAIGSLGWRFLKEAIALALAFLVASFVDPGRTPVFWMIFLGISAVRWLRAPRAVETTSAQKVSRLLTEMIAVHNRLASKHFNAGLVKNLLYSLEDRGAVFSRAVYSVLDKRIARVGQRNHRSASDAPW